MSADLPSHRRSVAVVGATQVANVGTAVAMMVALARRLDVPAVASAAWFLGLVAVVGPLATAGGAGGMIPLVARAPRRGSLVSAVVRRSLPVLVLGGIAAAGAVHWWAPDGDLLWAWLAVPWVVTGGLGGLIEAAARGAGHLGLAALANEWPRRLAVTAMVVFAPGSSAVERLNRSLLAAVVLHAAVLTTAWLLLRRRMPERDGTAVPRMWAFAAAQVIGLAVPQAGVLFVGVGGDPRAAADYGVAVRVSMIFTLVVAVAARAAAPRVAAAHDLRTLEPWLRRVAGWSTLGVALPLAALVVGGRWGLEVALGPGYGSAHAAAVLLGAMVLSTVGTGLSGLCLMNRGHAQVLAATSGVATVCFVVAAAVVGRVAGAAAVAGVAFGVIAVYGVVLAGIARRRLGINVWPSLSSRS